jgi:hypothetical protein
MNNGEIGGMAFGTTGKSQILTIDSKRANSAKASKSSSTMGSDKSLKIKWFLS